MSEGTMPAVTDEMVKRAAKAALQVEAPGAKWGRVPKSRRAERLAIARAAVDAALTGRNRSRS